MLGAFFEDVLYDTQNSIDVAWTLRTAARVAFFEGGSWGSILDATNQVIDYQSIINLLNGVF